MFCILSIILWMLSCCSKHADADNSGGAKLPLDSALNVLNEEMTKKEDYHRNKEERLRALKNDLRDFSSRPNFKVANELFDEYKAYQSDSAYKYASVMNQIATDASDPALQAKTNVAFADYFISVGFFKEAAEMLGKTDSRYLTTDEKCYFYNLYTRLYRSLCSYVGGPSSPLWPTYNQLNKDYLDSPHNSISPLKSP